MRATHSPRTLSENHQVRKNPKPKTQTPTNPKWLSITKEIDPVWIRHLLPLRLCIFQTVRRHGLDHPRGIVDCRVTEFVKVRKSPEDLPWVIGWGLCDLSSRGIWWGLSVRSCVFRTGCPGLCVLRFKYLATLTRRTTVTAVGTGLPNLCLHQAHWFYPSHLFIYSWSLWIHCMIALSFVFTEWLFVLIGFTLSSYLIFIA